MINLPCRRSGVWTAIAFFVVACQAALPQQTSPISPLGDTRQDAPKPPAVVTPPAGAAAPVDSSTYKIGPGDILNIDVWKELEFTCDMCTVHSDGKVTLKLVGDLQAGGKTPKQLETIVKDALAKYVLNPLVTITVQQVISKKYYLDGLVARPGEYSLSQPTTIFEALSRAGGLQEFANQKKIYILRGANRIPFNYKEVIHGKHLEQNVLLEPGDHVVVP
jgi:polysaccharide export outer membrane protein